jgi:uncharacterized protein (TIGR02217 family)
LKEGRLESFHEVRFPTRVSFGATGGPERRNEIVSLTSGREKRNLRFATSRRHFDAGTGVRSLADLYEIIAFFEARRGSFHGFRFRDPFDMKSCRPDEVAGPGDQRLGTGDGTNSEFQLVKWYGDGDDAYAREIRKPVAGTVRVAVAGVEKSLATDFDVELETGVVRFALSAVPSAGQSVTAGYEFDVPARFDTERIAISLSAFKAGQIPTIPIVEIEP